MGNTSCAGTTLAAFGSPPRLWGIQLASTAGADAGRFTPTAVGNTELPSTHPAIADGSPPRLWGIRERRARRPGLTVHPHGCGEYPTHRPRLTPWGGSPHGCGEYVEAGAHGRHFHGSPPRLWGIRFTTASGVRPLRFTPTAVGNTQPAVAARNYGSPPRLWGIRSKALVVIASLAVPPPRLWGIHLA